jgi:hypothetical protein
MLKSKILSAALVLMPATILLTSQSSFGEPNGDECKLKPGDAAPAGLHWYYRVDRVNNRHCWYLHAQGMPVHSRTPQKQDTQSENTEEPVSAMPAQTGTVQPTPQQSLMLPRMIPEGPQPVLSTREEPNPGFAARWVDLPRAVALNTREPIAASNAFSTERAVANTDERLPSSWPGVSAADGESQGSAASGTNFGSISLAGAAVLALLLLFEGLMRVARASAWRLQHRYLRANCRKTDITDASSSATSTWSVATAIDSTVKPEDSTVKTEADVGELTGILRRAGAGLRPPQSFAPTRSMRHHHPSHRRANHERASQDRASHERSSYEAANYGRVHSAFYRLKSRSFNGLTWAPL